MTYSPVVPEDCEGLRLRTFSWVEKYSPDQVAYANAHVDFPPDETGNYPARRVDHRYFRRFFREPEDGLVECAGNAFTTAGLTNLVSLWMGVTGTAVNSLKVTTGSAGAPGTSAAGPVMGIGTGTSSSQSDTIISTNGTANAWHQEADGTSPTVSYPGSAIVQMINTVASANANFAWNEWGWFTGAGTVTAGNAIASVYSTASSYAMVNHKAGASLLGTKASGAAWVFTSTMTIT